MRYGFQIFKSYKELKVFITIDKKNNDCMGSLKAFPETFVRKRYKKMEMDLHLYNQNKLCENTKIDILLQKI